MVIAFELKKCNQYSVLKIHISMDLGFYSKILSLCLTVYKIENGKNDYLQLSLAIASGGHAVLSLLVDNELVLLVSKKSILRS